MRAFRLGQAHLEGYRTLMLEAYALHPDAFTSTPEERSALPLSWWAQRIGIDDASESVAYGVERDGSLVGAVALVFETRTKLRHKCSLVGMYVREAHRGHGLGNALVEAALAGARARAGVRVVQLTVSEPNAQARRLYEQQGFVTFGLEPMAIAGQAGFVAKRHMWREL